MHPRTLTSLALISILALAGCSSGNSPEQLVTEQLTLMQEFGEALTKVTDEASAEQHKDAVEKIVRKMNALRREHRWLSEQERKACLAVGKELGPELQAAQGKMKSELARIQPSADIQRVLGPSLEML